MADTPETTTAKPAAAPQTKTAFVLSFPRDVSAAEVVAKAKAAGIALKVNHVSNIRSVAKAKRKTKRAAKKTAKAPAASKAAPAKKATTKSVATKAPTAKPSGKKRGRANPKKAFIASQPRTMPAVEVVAAAKKAGISISVDYVYKTRSKPGSAKKATSAAAVPVPATAKRGPGRPKGSKTKSPASAAASSAVKATPVAKTTAHDTSMEHVLARFVVAHGADRVRRALATVESRVHQLFGDA
ncbi:MAG: hypothetical protein ACHREM_18275 [Polyangiales bacterium]